MAQKTAINNHAANLRRQAEAQLLAQEEAELADLSPEATRRLLHELRAHQIELELQNEELRRTQQELDGAVARYFDLYELAPVGYCTLSDQGLILEANLTAAALLNMERRALVKQAMSRFILAEDQDIYYRHRRALFETGQPQGCELRLLRRGSLPFWARLEATVAHDAEGALVCRLVLSDITERKQAEQAEQESLAKLERLFELLPVGLSVLDDNHSIVKQNPALERILGISQAGLARGDYRQRQYLRPDGSQMPTAEFASARVRQGEPNVSNVETGVVKEDDTMVWTSVSAVAVPFSDWRTVIVTTDITERKRAEEARECYAARLQTLHDIERAILAVLSPEEIGAAAVTRLRQQIPCRYASISLIDFDRMEKIVFASDSDADSFIRPNERLPITSAWIAQLKQGQAITILDAAAVPDPTPPMQALLAEGIYSSINIPLQARGALIGVLSLAFNQPGAFSPEDVEIAAEVATSVALALDQARLLEVERTAHDRLQQLAHQLVTVQEEERRRLAHELHDEIGQVMLAVKTNLEALRLSQEPATLNVRLADSIHITSRALAQIRAMALNLRPSLLDDFGLQATLEWYLERQASDTPFSLNFQSDLGDIRFPAAVEINCFRVVQAAVANIARHAQASQVVVMLRWQPQERLLEFSVADNGQGFDVAAALDQARRGQSLGLLGMQERVQLMGGQLEINATPGQGTEIRVRVPVTAER